MEEHNGPGRPRLTFTAVAQHEREGSRRSYQLLADMLAGFIADTSPAPAAQAAELGRTWGRYLATRPAPGKRVTEEESLRELLHVLDDIGFSPLLAEDDQQSQVLLRHCPFLEVASAHGEVVCSLHLGVMQGVLIEQRAPLEAGRLQPFVEPSLRVAHLSRRGSSPSLSCLRSALLDVQTTRAPRPPRVCGGPVALNEHSFRQLGTPSPVRWRITGREGLDAPFIDEVVEVTSI